MIEYKSFKEIEEANAKIDHEVCFCFDNRLEAEEYLNHAKRYIQINGNINCVYVFAMAICYIPDSDWNKSHGYTMEMLNKAMIETRAIHRSIMGNDICVYDVILPTPIDLFIN